MRLRVAKQQTPPGIQRQVADAKTGGHEQRSRPELGSISRMLVHSVLQSRSSPRARETERRFGERVRAAQRKGVDVPRELTELDARLARLHDRLRRGEPT